MANSPVSIEVSGIKELKKYMKEKQEITKEELGEGVRKAALHMHGAVKTSIARGTNASVAVDTGKFLNSVDFSSLGEEDAIVFTNLSYAKFIEFGTSRMGARPHFRNTAAKEKQKVKDIIQKRIFDGIKKGLKKL